MWDEVVEVEVEGEVEVPVAADVPETGMEIKQ
jgi:hypothetical protein